MHFIKKLTIVINWVIINLFITNLAFSQIITSENEIEDMKASQAKEQKEMKTSTASNNNGSEYYFGLAPHYNFRTLEVNEGLFSAPLGEKVNEKAAWSTNFLIGFRQSLTKHILLDAGFGFLSNRESYLYEANDTTISYTNTYRNIGLPIKFAFNTGEKINFYTGLGINMKALISQKIDELEKFPGQMERTEKTILKEGFNKFLIDASASLGVRTEFSPDYGFYFLIEASRQLNPTHNAQYPHIHKPYSLGMQFGFQFYL